MGDAISISYVKNPVNLMVICAEKENNNIKSHALYFDIIIIIIVNY